MTTQTNLTTTDLELSGDTDTLWDVIDAVEGTRVGRLHYDEDQRLYTAETLEGPHGEAPEMLASRQARRVALNDLCDHVNRAARIHALASAPRAVLSLGMLREALRVAEEQAAKMATFGHGTDSPQIHLVDRYEEEGVVVVELLSNEYGQVVERYSIDAGDAPGESGKAERI